MFITAAPGSVLRGLLALPVENCIFRAVSSIGCKSSSELSLDAQHLRLGIIVAYFVFLINIHAYFCGLTAGLWLSRYFHIWREIHLHKKINTYQAIMVLSHLIVFPVYLCLCVCVCRDMKLNMKIARLVVSGKSLCINYNVLVSFFLKLKNFFQ